jgi:CBS domain-containing protein
MNIERTTPAFKRLFFEGKISSLKPHVSLTAPVEANLGQVIKVLVDHSVCCVPLVDKKGNVAGIISERDLLKVAGVQPAELEAKAVRGLMSSPVTTLPYYASIARVLHAMCIGGFRHVPITGGKSGLAVTSTTDLVAYLHAKISPHIEKAELNGDSAGLALSMFMQPVSSLSPVRPVTIKESVTAFDAAMLMQGHKIGSILAVSESGRLVGIFTERDLVRRVFTTSRNARAVPLSEVMTPNPRTLQDSSTVSLALSTFVERRYRHLPIVNEDESLIGTLSVRDFVLALTRDILKELA